MFLKRLIIVVFLSLNITFGLVAQTFTEITESTGISDLTTLTDTFGKGAAIADYDGDGDLDIFVGTEFGFPSQVYENLGNRLFQEVALNLGITTTYRIRTALWFDYDGDHLLDLVLLGDCYGIDESCTDRIILFVYKQNINGTFSEIQNSGLEFGDRYDFANIRLALAGGLAAGDFNNDGWLDLIVTVWGREFFGAKASVFLNNTDGTFTDITVSSNLGQQNASRYQPLVYDFNHDGFQDIYINVDFSSNELWINNGDNTFQDIASSIGADSAFNEMGIALGDYDNDNDFDIYATNISTVISGELRHNIFLNNNWSTTNTLAFTEISNSLGIGASGWDWGTTFFDANNNGWLDLAITNGYNEQDWGADQSRIWQNVDGLAFSDISITTGFNDTKSAATLLAFDMDRDGDLDLLQSIKEVGDKYPILLYQNDTNTLTDTNYIVIKPRMNGTNHFAIGAVVKIQYNNGMTGMRLITAGTSYYGQEPAEAFFGLSDNTNIDEVRIEWPDNTTTVVEDVAANQVITITNDVLSNDEFKSVNIKLYPNPVSDVLTIESTTQINSIEVYNVLGQKIVSKTNRDTKVNLNIKHLNSGHYFLKVHSLENNTLETYHIIKQ